MLGAVRYVARILGWLVAIIVLPIVLASILGNFGLLVGIAADLLAILWVWLWLPRSAHGAFAGGHFANATRRYRILGAVTRSAERERAALLSRIGCAIAAGELDRADRLLGAIDAASLDAQERAVWLNNRACVVLARGSDPHAALALIDEASALRPDVPALQHTRGMALLAVGRVDDAIAVLDGMRAAGDLGPRLEADRCRELALAWTKKGETAYADDYRLRADALTAR
jgi:predicted Zn-dependent protease